VNFVQGADRSQITMFPEAIDDYIDDNNSVRVIDVYVDSLNMKSLGFKNTTPNEMGRPMYSPQLMLKIYLYGYLNKIRSTRRLETESKRNLEMIWLTKKLSPDHKTISRFRKDNPRALKKVFRDFVKLCSRLGLYGKELVAVDGSRFSGVNSKDKNFNDSKLKDRIKRLNIKIDQYIEELDNNDEKEDTTDNPKSAEEIKEIIKELKSRKEEYEQIKKHLEETEETQVSLVDPDTRRLTKNGETKVGFNVQTAVDSKNKMIAEFDVTNSINDFGHLSSTSQKAKEILEVDTIKSTADKGYNSATDIAECLMNGIEPHVCMEEDEITICLEILGESKDVEENIDPHVNGRFVYLKNRNIALCPMGKIFYPSSYSKSKKEARFCNRKECRKCPNKCTVSEYKDFGKKMKKREFTKEYDDNNLRIKQVRVKKDPTITKQRKEIVEHPYGTVKRAMDSEYCLMRGMNNVVGEFSLAFLAYNLKRAVNILGCRELIQAITNA